jgi:hypothetical protein
MAGTKIKAPAGSNTAGCQFATTLGLTLVLRSHTGPCAFLEAINPWYKELLKKRSDLLVRTADFQLNFRNTGFTGRPIRYFSTPSSRARR